MSTSAVFDRYFDFLIQPGIEGGLVNAANDPGGLTKYGISQRWYPDLDIKNLTPEQAKVICKRDYWDRCQADSLPPGIAVLIVDSAFNQGPTTAIRLLQRSLRVTQDGVMGAETKAALLEQPAGSIIDDIMARRALLYAASPLISSDGLGWYRRLARMHRLAIDVQAVTSRPV